MDNDKYKIWQDTMKEILVLKGLLTELEKRIDVLYEKTDEQLDKENDNDPQRKNNSDG